MADPKEQGNQEVPLIQAEFAEHLAKYRIKPEIVDTIAAHIAEVGGVGIFENPDKLNEILITWSQYISGSQRKPILEHWCAKKQLSVTDEQAKIFGFSPADVKKEDKKKDKKNKVKEGKTWVIKQDDKGAPRIMWAQEGEEGITMDEAKKAVRELRKEYIGEEPLVLIDPATGKHTPNLKNEFVKANPVLGWAAARQMDKAAAAGEEVDPMDYLIDQEVKHAQLMELTGGAKPPESKGTVAEIVSALKDLQEMAKTGQATMPEWLSDPVKFMEIVKTLNPKEEGGGAPSWTSDPVKFMEVLEKFTGKTSGEDALKTEVADLRKTIEANERQRNLDLATAQQNEIRALRTEVKELVDSVTELKRPVTGRTEMDLLHEIATEGLNLAKAELPGLRGDIRDAVRGGGLPAPKTPEEREARKERYRKNLEADKEIEEIYKRMFFPREQG